jgi:hypothetical protein
MTKSASFLSVVFPLLLLAGCASVPSGPSLMALPGTGKNFDQFRADEADCRQYAKQQIGGSDAEHAAMDAGVRSAAVGTVVGAVAGAAIGGHEGAGVGAGAGLVVGSMAGANAAPSSAYGAQRNYDNAYIQCMYAKGHKVPVSGAVARSRAQAPAETPSSAPAPTPPSGYYPPPPGYQPPPPAMR